MLEFEKIKQAIADVKEMRNKNIKARVDIVLDNGDTLSIYHLGANNKTIRMDLKLNE